MARYKRGNIDQGELLAINLHEQFDEYSREVLLKKFVAKYIDIQRFDKYYFNDETGRKGKHPQDVISAILYGYLQGIHSSHKVENLLRTHIGFMYVSNRLSIDHSKLCDFKIQFDEEITNLFAVILFLLNSIGEIDWEVVVGDGTKIKANASKSKTMTKERADKVMSAYRKMAAKVVKRSLDTDEKLNRGELEGEKYKDEKKRIERQEKLYNRVMEQVEVYQKMLEEERLKEGDKVITGKDHYNLTDPDSSLTLGPDKSGYIQGYNIKMMISNNDIILSCKNEKLDEKKSAKPMIEEVENLKEELGVKQKSKYLLDSGFENMPVIVEMEENGLDCYIDVKEKDFSELSQKRKNFEVITDDKGGICLRCAGKHSSKGYIDEKNEKMHFFFNRTQCKGCFIYEDCYKKIKPKRSQKTVNFSLFELSHRKEIDRYLNKLRSEEGQNIYNKRIGKEHNFSNLKTQKDFLRTYYRGNEKVGMDCRWNVVAHNLNKYFQALVRKGLAI